MDTSGGILNKLKDLGPELCIYFLENYFENENGPPSFFHTIPTALLREQETYTKGLLVLDIFLNYSTPDCLNKAGSAWMTMLMKHVSLDMPFTCSVELSYRLLGKIINKSDVAKELAKAISTNFATRLALNIVESPKNCQLVALQCLSSCLLHSGGTCSPLQGRIEKYLLTFVDAQDENLCLEAARCLLLLQQLAGGGVHGVNHQKSWGRLQTRLLGNLSDTLSAIFGEELSADPETSFVLPEIDLSAGPLKRTVDLIQRFKNLCSVFNVALLGAFKTTKPVQPVKILKLISRTVEAMGNSARSNLTLEDVVIVNLLPSMHESILNLLRALIALLRGNMVLFSRSICAILLSSLKCSAKSICVEDISESFITSIIRDTKPFVLKVQLQVNGLSSKGKQSKRLKRKLGVNLENEGEKEDVLHRHLNEGKYEKLCAEALNCLRQLIRCGSCFMKLDQMKRIYEHTTTLILQNVEIDRKRRPLYANRECRRSLFLVLKELLVSSYTITLPQSQFLIQVFSQAQHMEIWHENRILCVEILADLERVIHPQKLEFTFPSREEVAPLKLSNGDDHEVEDREMMSEDEKTVTPELPDATNQADEITSVTTDGDILMKNDKEVQQNQDKDNKPDEVEKEIDEEQEKIPEDTKKEDEKEAEKIQNTQENVLEIDSSDDAPNDDVQVLSDEEVVYMPSNDQKNNLSIPGSSKQGSSRGRNSPIILDEDSNDDDVRNLMSFFVDDVNK
uniref:Pre-rRNA-processing protein RIX1 N-terminal domain-containing protein n=1 Tax=Lutzomyia longipalpis TaxID=7200 RepID=A0A7G3AFF4_LUTLO